MQICRSLQVCFAPESKILMRVSEASDLRFMNGIKLLLVAFLLTGKAFSEFKYFFVISCLERSFSVSCPDEPVSD